MSLQHRKVRNQLKTRFKLYFEVAGTHLDV